jgi:NitT/TauT family transport system substrate-binding protein
MRRALLKRGVLIAVVAVLVAACGGGKSGGGSSSSGKTNLTVGLVPVIDIAPLYLGLKHGFFTDEGLNVTPKLIQTGATVVSGAVSGQLQIGFSNTTSLVIAASKNIPVQIIAAGVSAGTGDYAGLLVRNDGSIKTPKDLEGKKIAVNGLKNVGSLTVNAALESLGVDYTKVNYIEVPFPNMGTALVRKQIDAAWVVEPFVSANKAASNGTHLLLQTYMRLPAHYPVAAYFVSQAYKSGHADVVAKFQRAINKALDYAQAHPDEVRQILPTYIKITPQAAGHLVLPEWSTNPYPDLIKWTADHALKYGYITSEPDMSKLVATGS